MKHQKVRKIKKGHNVKKNMDKYTLLKRFHNDLQLRFYMYAFMYVNSETMPEEDYFRLQKRLLRNTRNCQLQDQPQNNRLNLVT